MSAGEQLLKQGREQGREQGRREGEVKGVLKGERRLLLRILARLGTITPAIDARIQAAEEGDLEKWAELALSANTVEDVFEFEG